MLYGETAAVYKVTALTEGRSVVPTVTTQLQRIN